jgi:heme-degrading monooxygenase HmoA
MPEIISEVIMIARIWHGTTRPEKADSYLDYLNRTGMPDYQHTTGNLGAYVMRRIENGVAHFFTLTFWDSYDAIKRFAGKNYEKARYYPEDKDFLLEFEPNVEHFEVFGFAGTPAYVRNYAASRQLPRWW